MNLKGKTAIVTGANQGIGKAISEELAKNGVNVVLISNKQSELEDVAQTLNSLGTSSLPIVADVRNAGQVKEAVDKAIEQFGTIDILINNAGVTFFGGVEKCTEEEWDKTLETNVKGYFLTTKSVLTHMINQKNGVIINMSSIWGKKGSSSMVAYSTSKFAVEGFTQSLLEEVKPYGIKVSSIVLDKVNTPFRDNMSNYVSFSDEQKDRMITATDVAESVMWVLNSSTTSLPSSIQLDAILW